MGSYVQAADLPVLAPARHAARWCGPCGCLHATYIYHRELRTPMGLASIRVTTIRPSRITISARCALIRGIGYRLLRYRDLFRVPSLFSALFQRENTDLGILVAARVGNGPCDIIAPTR